MTITAQPLILLVEDNEDHAELIMRTLADHPIAHRLLHLSDGQQALDYLARQGQYADPSSSPRPQVVFLDLRLPKVEGLEVLRQLKESSELRDIPVVVLTTSAAERDVSRAYEHHVNSYVVKPADFDKFNKLMEDLGFYWLQWNVTSFDKI